MSATEVTTAHDRLVEFFRNRDTRAGVLARRRVQLERPQDQELVEHLVRERRRRTRIDGSVDGALVPTAWLSWELLQLDCPPDHAGVVRTVGYLLAQQDKPGRLFGEGCDPERHRLHTCAHYMSGFFAAAPEDRAVAPLVFPSGVRISDEPAARFAASCFALRTTMRAGEDRRASVRGHLASLMQFEELWSGAGPWSTDLAFFAIGALALAPLDLRDRVAPLVDAVINQQGDGGAWPGVDPFHALDMLSLVPSRAARDAAARSARYVASRLEEPGALDGDVGEERALILLGALTLAIG